LVLLANITLARGRQQRHHRAVSIRAFIATAAACAISPAWAAQTYGGCPLFPADNYWNTRIDTLPVHPSSAAWVNAVGTTNRLHPDFSNNLADGFGFTPRVVNSGQLGVPIFYYPTGDPTRSDPGPYPIPPELATGTGDREVTVLENSNCFLFEFYGAPQNGGTSWITYNSAKWDVRSNALRIDGAESGDQAGLPFLVGMLRWEEVAAGEIGHAIRFTSTNAWGMDAVTGAMKYLWPARHGSGTSTDSNSPPMGARFRLKASFNVSSFDARTQIVLRAFQRYGMVLSSRGGNWYLQGISDPNWPDVVIDELRSIPGDSFEVVDTAPLMVNVNSGQAVQLASGPAAPTNLAVTQGAGQATFTFIPVSGATPPITSYVVTCDPGGLSASGAGSPITVSGFGNGAYTCVVRAVNANGPGAPSNVVTVSFAAPPPGDDGFPPGGVPSGWFQPAGSNAPWGIASDSAFGGAGQSLKSGAVGAGQRSELAYYGYLAAGSVSFARRIAAQPSDVLQFFVDGILQGSWTGNSDWAIASVPIAQGAHSLLWRFTKGDAGAGAAWIDHVSVPNVETCPIRLADGRCFVE
jgi:hypothetical protein